jgi:small-conductance mechanosensitive channel
MRLITVADYMLPAAFAVGGLAVGLALRRLLLPRFARAAAKSAWKYDDVLVDAVSSPLVVAFALLGVHIAVKLLSLTAAVDRALGQAVLVLAIFTVTWAVARFTAGALRTGATAGALPGVSLIANVSRVVVVAVGLLVILQTLGISITPIITALGVGGLAVALALQDTLANLFAGIRILASGKLRPGDFVRLETGQEGTIEDITWAQTTIRQQPNNVVIVPNAKLSTAITTNFSLPDIEQSVPVTLGVSYASDLEQVERVTLEVAREVLRGAEGGVAGFEPAVRFHSFGESSIELTVVLRVMGYENRATVIHEFIKRLHKRYAAEGIEIPFPIRTVRMERDAKETP